MLTADEPPPLKIFCVIIKVSHLTFHCKGQGWSIKRQ